MSENVQRVSVATGQRLMRRVLFYSNVNIINEFKQNNKFVWEQTKISLHATERGRDYEQKGNVSQSQEINAITNL